MFGNRRRRATSNPPLNGSNANSNATSAAAQAFLKNRPSTASLAAAAAGAALRSRPTTPINVGEVETKRTVRRSGSTSSIGSSVAGSRGPGSRLERRGSSGSMTERTFRDPSPGPAPPVPSAPDAPPVPLIPTGLRAPQVATSNSHRRAASLEAPAMRVASPPPRPSGRGSSLEPAASYRPPRAGHQRNTSLSSVQEYDRPASRGSVNFSYPTSARPESPQMQGRRLTSPSRANAARIVSPTNQNLIYDPNTRKFLPEAEILAIEQKLYDAAQKPVKKKKKAPPQNSGIHLEAGTASHFLGPKGTAVDAMETAKHQPPQAAPPVELAAHVPEQRSAPAPAPAPVAAAVSTPEPAAVPAKKKKKKVKVVESESDEGSYQPNSSDTDSDRSAKPAAFNTRAGAMLVKRPSVVREDREREEEEDDTPVKAKSQDGPFPLFAPVQEERGVSPSPLPRSQAGRGRGTALTPGQPKTSSSESSPIEPSAGSVKMKDSARGGRVPSISPARTAHFAATPEGLTIKHQPPPRAISPRKSAMKHSGTDSPRAQSPLPGYVPEGSEASAGSELSVPKKKANRVSFDEHNIVVGTAAGPVTTNSPVVASPQSKRTWLPFGRGKKKEIASVDDEDEVMQPRPALPSFGSVREKKTPREAEHERPLVKPTELVEYKPLETSAPPIMTSPIGEVVNKPLGQSKDHVAGALLAQEAASKNAANISKSREPLPPQVLSVEGSGDNSESEDSVHESDGKKSNGHISNGKPARGFENAEEYHEVEDDVPTPRAGSPTSEVPEIQVLQATPTLESTDSKREWPDMPGVWGSTTESSNSDSGRDDTQPPIVNYQPTEPTIADLGISEPDPIVHPSPPVGEIALQNSIHTPIIEEQEPESEVDSIYSDAAEDLFEPEGDGFMSLNAVADSPVSKVEVPIGVSLTPTPDIPRRETDSPTPVVVKERAFKQSRLSLGSEKEPEVDESWENVQKYWKTLSPEQKKQLELEAKEAAEGSDTETEVKPAPKPKKKKKKVVVATEPIAQPQHQPPINERQYGFQPGAKAGPHGHPAVSSMRTSMRTETPKPAAAANSDAHIRKSMRGPTSMRGSLRGEAPPETRGSLQKKHRLMSFPPPVEEVKADPTAVQMHVRALSAASARAAGEAAHRDANPPPMPTLRRRGSGDSQSSFRKKKRPTSAASTMRSSMRGSQDLDHSQQMPPLPSSSRFSVRSLSPTGSGFRRPFSSASNISQPTGPPTHMRNSMRSGVGPAPTMRARPASSGGFFGRSSAAKPDKKKAAPKPKPSSRFADSSDEEDSRPSFRSRFVDSSDEDEPSTPQPARSNQTRVPPRSAIAEAGDSSDLPDSDDGAGPSSPAINKKGNGTTAAPGSTLATGSLRAPPIPVSTTPRPPTTRRGSFMSSILRRKKDPSSGGIRKSDLESPARRDTPLERSKSDLQSLKLASPSGSTKSPKPRLVKRNTGFSSASRTNSGIVPTIATSENPDGEAWPLPDPHPIPLSKEGEEGRPYTADGEPSFLSKDSDRPDIGNRRFTATGLSGVDLGLGNSAKVVAGTGEDSVGSSGGGKKKKKFGSLRRLFRLDE